MSSDEYVADVIRRHALPATPTFGVQLAKGTIEPVIRQWANQYLLGFDYSGSLAKGTGIIGTTDADFFISLSPDTRETLADIYNSLANCLERGGYIARRQNVSIGITVGSVSVDVVPAKKHRGYTSDHSLYRSKANTWIQTNVATHVRIVSQSGRIDEIRAAKIWRKLHKIAFPSFYLEMSVINALSGKRTGCPGENFWKVLQHFAGDWASAVIYDPANTNNRLSDDLTASEKQRIVTVAKGSLAQSNWGTIIW